jgi:hypothetical protein
MFLKLNLQLQNRVMGAGQSKTSFSGQLSRADLLKATNDTRGFMNFLFRFFIEQIAQKDILALGNPKSCSEYVFVMADALQRLFDEVRIRPGKDKDGVVFFKKTQELTKIDTASPEGIQRRELCISVALFYIRIFQIYAALTLSMNDDETYGSSIQRSTIAGPQRATTAPGLAPVYYGGALQVGGVTTDNLSSFRILKNYVTRDTSYPRGGKYYLDQYPNIILDATKQTQNLTITKDSVADSGAPAVITCNFKIQVSTSVPDKYLLTFERFISMEPQFNRLLRLNGPIPIWIFKKNDEYSSENGEPIDDIINTIMTNSQKVAIGRRQPNIARVRARQVSSDSTGVSGLAPDQFISDGFKTAQLITSLKTQKPLAHCIARSLQLINMDPLSQTTIPGSVRTSICKTKFETARGGVPDNNSPITQEAGIAALQQLFFDKISDAKLSMSADSSELYKLFVQKMSKEFAEGENPALQQLSSVKSKTTRMCGQGKTDKILTISEKTAITEAQKAIQDLWRFQIEHNVQAVNIMKSLVRVVKLSTGQNQVGINPILLQLGNPGVNEIAKEARKLLVKYYANCESRYRAAANALSIVGRPD